MLSASSFVCMWVLLLCLSSATLIEARKKSLFDSVSRKTPSEKQRERERGIYNTLKRKHSPKKVKLKISDIALLRRSFLSS
jgi:hypothetical protein